MQPDAHGVVVLAEEHGLAHAFHALELVDDVHLRVVVHEHAVVPTVGRDNREEEQEGRRLLDDGNAQGARRFRQLRLRQVDAVADVDQVHVGVGAQLEVNEQVARAGAGGRRGGHVEHVLDTVDLHFEGRQHRAGYGFGRSAGVVRRHGHSRRNEVRILRDGQHLHGNGTAEGDDDGDDARENRAPQKNTRSGRCCCHERTYFPAGVLSFF